MSGRRVAPPGRVRGSVLRAHPLATAGRRA
ncbi:MAG: hypothetical protein KatS3mg102_2921 [Planctomycetota bacterium]|nr:MAG: hypothetical protein KatS3mg102_2921 [Planctomycetota bacterium]